jgi:hypothetical protein
VGVVVTPSGETLKIFVLPAVKKRIVSGAEMIG